MSDHRKHGKGKDEQPEKHEPKKAKPTGYVSRRPKNERPKKFVAGIEAPRYGSKIEGMRLEPAMRDFPHKSPKEGYVHRGPMPEQTLTVFTASEFKAAKAARAEMLNFIASARLTATAKL